jgi:hypothetical protein
MRVIQFPSRRGTEADAAVLAELEAAFDGDGTGAEAEAWRELRADVRALAAPIDPAFQRSLEQQLRSGSERASTPRRRLRAWPPAGLVRSRGALAAGTALALVAAIVLAATQLGGSHSPPAAATFSGGTSKALKEHGPAEPTPSPVHASKTAESEVAPQESSASGAAGTLAAAPGGEAPGESATRLQHLEASISLGAGSEGVQVIADRVGLLAVAAGGFVESSKVELQHGSAGEATLTLKLPSAKLAGTLAKLQRLAPVRAESQSLQDLSGQYNALGARLAAARAERSALLRALAKAESAAALESLHQRIAQADGAIASEERQQASISRTASQAQVEVSVLGETAHASGGLTLGRGLHDAGHILVVALAVVLIALAVLVPLALLLVLLAIGARGWRRQQRERALGPG